MTDLPGDDRNTALGALDQAVAIYRIVLAGRIDMWGTEVGGFFNDATIALDDAGAVFVADSVHHELSPIVRNQLPFNVGDRTANNPPRFAHESLAAYKAISPNAHRWTATTRCTRGASCRATASRASTMTGTPTPNGCSDTAERRPS